MTTLELNASLLRELSTIASDEQLLEKAIKAIKAIKHDARKARAAKAADLTPYTIEEIHTMIAEGEAEFEAGDSIDSQEMSRRMKQKFPWL